MKMDFSAVWNRLWYDIPYQLSPQQSEACNALYVDLLAAYAEPHRHYHTQQHLAECLELWQEYYDVADDPVALGLALWFHDAVYDPLANDNEARSAEWARRALSACGLPSEQVHMVATLVLATQHGQTPCGQSLLHINDCPDLALISDIDLAILGAGRVRFAEYEAQIRAEYPALNEAEFQAGRQAVLQGFLQRRIYQLPDFYEGYEATARHNLEGALAKALTAA